MYAVKSTSSNSVGRHWYYLEVNTKFPEYDPLPEG